jgi:hypothetical protein
VNRILEGWANDSPWYPAKASVLAAPAADTGRLREVIESHSPALFFRFEDATMGAGDTVLNVGSSTEDGLYYGTVSVGADLVPDGAQSADMRLNSYITLVDSPDYHYYDNPKITIGVFLQFPTGAGWGGEALIWHHGDRGISSNQGQLIQLVENGDKINATYYASGDWRSHDITFSSTLPRDEPVFLGIVHSTTGGDNGFGYMKVYVNCVLEGTVSFTHAVPDTTYPASIGGRRTNGGYDIYMGGYVDDFFLCTSELTQAQLSEIADEGRVCQTGAMNPAHIIYEAITNPDWGMGYSSAIIDTTSFTAAADTFYSEGLGLSLQWTTQSTVEDFIQIILDHAGAVLRVSPTTGQFQIKPLRADYDAGTLDTYDESKIVAIENFERAGYGELTSEVTVIYTDVTTGKDASVTVQNLAAIQAQSGVVAETVRYPGFETHFLASRIASRDLRAKSVPLARVKFKTTRSAWELQPGDVFKLTWAKLGLSAVVCRVVGISTGTLLDGTITIDAVEDVFGLPDSVYASEQSGLWEEPVPPLGTDATSFRETEAEVDRIDEATNFRILE